MRETSSSQPPPSRDAVEPACEASTARIAATASGGSGLVFNIQRYAIHDGAGVRTLVFMKGCPLRCPWCSNPEGQKGHPETGFMEGRCVGAETCRARCVEACDAHGITLSPEGRPVIDRGLCAHCGKCGEACYYGALSVVGREMTVEQVLSEVEKDRPFYRRSGGGVTVGGGEPLMQPAFVSKLLEACHRRHLHTALETTGFASPQLLHQVLDHVDLLYFDIKHMDAEKHRQLTGVSNEPVLETLRGILSDDHRYSVIVRVTTVPGFNDSDENIAATARFAAEAGCREIELVPYHKLGVAKYGQYGMEYELRHVEAPSRERMQELRRLVESFGVKEMTGAL